MAPSARPRRAWSSAWKGRTTDAPDARTVPPARPARPAGPGTGRPQRQRRRGARGLPRRGGRWRGWGRLLWTRRGWRRRGRHLPRRAALRDRSILNLHRRRRPRRSCGTRRTGHLRGSIPDRRGHYRHWRWRGRVLASSPRWRFGLGRGWLRKQLVPIRGSTWRSECSGKQRRRCETRRQRRQFRGRWWSTPAWPGWAGNC